MALIAGNRNGVGWCDWWSFSVSAAWPIKSSAAQARETLAGAFFVRCPVDLNKITAFRIELNDGIAGVGMLLGLAVLVQARSSDGRALAFGTG